MAMFEYRCAKCDSTFEKIIRHPSDHKGLTCPACGSRRLRKQISRLAAHVSAGSAGSAGARSSSADAFDANCVSTGGGCGCGGSCACAAGNGATKAKRGVA
jgi:putative FmdB family regulatory protein